MQPQPHADLVQVPIRDELGTGTAQVTLRCPWRARKVHVVRGKRLEHGIAQPLEAFIGAAATEPTAMRRCLLQQPGAFEDCGIVGVRQSLPQQGLVLWKGWPR